MASLNAHSEADKKWEPDHWCRIHERYQPVLYNGGAEIFFAKQRFDEEWQTNVGLAYRVIGFVEQMGLRFFWRRMVRGGIRFHSVPGTHMTILSESNAPHLAREIDGALKRASLRLPE